MNHGILLGRHAYLRFFMPLISHLHLHQFRNFDTLKLEFSPGSNLIIGPNGTGKTSILESIFFLAYGKSFRAKELNRLTLQGTHHFTLYAEGKNTESQTFKLGMQRGGGAAINRIDGENIKTLRPFAQALPLILLEPNSFQLLLGGARHRRKLLDWGVFYHHPESHAHYALVRKALQQRNQALKLKNTRSDVRVWEQTCIQSCEALDTFRSLYLKNLSPKLNALLGEAFINQHEINLHYDRGWSHETSLLSVWDQHFQQDSRLGYTEKGPHQADLKIYAKGKPAKDMLSRGQQKLFISMLKLAQGLFLQEIQKMAPIYLFDDLASELDLKSRKKMAVELAETQSQILISQTEAKHPFGREIKIINLTNK